jgi:cytidylate kinase
MTLVALSAAYGAGGSVVGPALARRLDVPFLDRAIPLAVADRLDVPFDDAAAHDGQIGGGWLERALSGFMGGDPSAPTPLPADGASSEDFRRVTEEVLLQQAATGEGVLLGRGAVILFRHDPRVLRVRLGGPAERRARMALRFDQNLDRERAERALRHFDSTHEAYAEQFYGVNIHDPALYHVMLDSTAIDLDTCVEIVARAAQALRMPTGQASIDAPQQ